MLIVQMLLYFQKQKNTTKRERTVEKMEKPHAHKSNDALNTTLQTYLLVALSSMLWWLTPASFVLGGGCLCVPSSLLVERSAKYLEVGLKYAKRK